MVALTAAEKAAFASFLKTKRQQKSFREPAQGTHAAGGGARAEHRGVACVPRGTTVLSCVASWY